MKKNLSLVRLDDYTEQEKEDLIEQRISLRKRMSRFNASVRNTSKNDKCAICNSNMTSFCNSHPIPAMCLRKIARNGMIYPFTGLLKSPIVDNTVGVNKTGTFALICKECDHHYFYAYEDPKALVVEPSQKILCEIALKNYLRSEFKARNVMNSYIQLMQMNQSIDMHEALYVEELAIETYKYEQRNILRVLNKINENKIDTDIFQLLYFDVINYVTPIAFQNRVAMFCDFEGRMINDIYDLSRNNKIQDLHICVYPLANETVVIVFNKYEDTRYRSFRKQFGKLQNFEKQSVLNYIMLCYSEEYYYSPYIHSFIASDESLIKAINKAPNPKGINTADCKPSTLHKLAFEMYKLSEHWNTTNLFDPMYQLEQKNDTEL